MTRDFHPAVAAWFERAFPGPTPVQAEAWPAIRAGEQVLIAAPTGSGKTLAAFLGAIDRLVCDATGGGLAEATQVVYVSPLKALSNDIQRNLEAPLAGIDAELARLGLPPAGIRTFVRTGDTTARERAASTRRHPHIVVTTPESLYILMGSASGRRMLSTTRTVIVDEIHALAGNKRGAHLALTLERLEALVAAPLARIGLSATQKPIADIARFLVGTRHLRADGSPACTIVDRGHVRERDLALELTDTPLEAVMSGDAWTQVYDRLAALAGAHRSTLVFVNTRRHAERIARHLSERLGAQHVAAHHGSLAKELRLAAETRLKAGTLRALVATSSLELGIDIGDVDLVCQIGSPRAIAAFLQRVGRSGHAVGATPRGRLFPLSRDDLVECAALLAAVRRGELDRLRPPSAPRDVLAQQIVAEVAAAEWDVDGLYALLTHAHPYRDLPRREFDDVVTMLAAGFATRRGRRGALVHHDAVNRRLKGRRGARLTALTSGGTIPDTADYQVLLEPQSHVVGTVNEDFAIESMQGDIFQLGNVSYRILRVESGKVRVEDAHGAPPSIPFWIGEAPGRTDELSAGVSQLRAALGRELERGVDAAQDWAREACGLGGPAAAQLVAYCAAARAALGVLPTQQRIVLERFFDEAGGMQLVIHAPFGSRTNKAWGLALRKRFCRSFNFELQAAATEDAIVLSLTTAHSFELAEVARYLNSATVRPLLVQALCAAPMFPVRWRWSAAIALALPRFRGGRKVPAPLARMAAEDLLAAVFPDQVACLENIAGDLEIPEHPLVEQAIRDCLEDAMDVAGLERLLRAIEAGTIEVVARDLTEPSPLALEILAARPYAFLDDAPLEERRTQAVIGRRWLDAQSAADIGRLDPAAIARVRGEAWPDAANADELHDALLWLTCITPAEAQRGTGWQAWLAELAGARRATLLSCGATRLWVAAERLPLLGALYPEARYEPVLEPPAGHDPPPGPEEALIEVVRGRLEGSGPVTVAALAAVLGLPSARIETALAALQAEGFAMCGTYDADAAAPEWCERRLLARIHRYTVRDLRAQIEPVSARDFLRFLFEWQRVADSARMQGPDAVGAILAQLEGFEAAASAWETEILPSRITGYEPAWLDEQCLAGRYVWTRLAARRGDPQRGAAPVRATPIVLLARRHLASWSSLAGAADGQRLTAGAQRIVQHLGAHGASFFDELAGGTGLLPTQAEEALAELVALGLVNSDSYAGLRALLMPSDLRRGGAAGRAGRRRALFGMDAAGRWARTGRSDAPGAAPATAGGGTEVVELVVRTLLKRWGVLFWHLLAREAQWLPPWRELLLCCRRLEARGEIRGGRFVAGFSGEQYALPEAVPLLRAARRNAAEGQTVAVSGADPLNLAGVVTPGPRVPALAGNRLLYRDGVPIATLIGGEVAFLAELEPADAWAARNLLLRRAVPATLADLA